MPRPTGTTVFPSAEVAVTAPRWTSGPLYSKPNKRKLDPPHLSIWKHRLQFNVDEKDGRDINRHLDLALPSSRTDTEITVVLTRAPVTKGRGRLFGMIGGAAPSNVLICTLVEDDNVHLFTVTLPTDSDATRELSQVVTKFQQTSKLQDSFGLEWTFIASDDVTKITIELELQKRDSCIIDWKAEKWLPSLLETVTEPTDEPISLTKINDALNKSGPKGGITARDFYNAVHVPPPDVAVPEVIQVNELTTTMFPFQMRTVDWMMKREGVTAESGSIESLPTVPFLESLCFQETLDCNERPMFVSIPLGLTSSSRPDVDKLITACGMRGGILAEEMGLGKTVELISLLALHKRQINDGEEEVYDVFSDKTTRASASTLIICPPSIIQQWVTELQMHAPGLRVLIYNGTRDLAQIVYQKQNAKEGRLKSQKYMEMSFETQSVSNADLIDHLLQYDIVLSTYNVLATEIHYAEKPPERSMRRARRFERRNCPLVEISWWRVCLDEAQMVENGVSNSAKVARLIPRVNAWAVTGTPVQKSIEDLYGLLVFLRQGPWCGNKNIWEKLCLRKEWFSRVFGELALRHTKDIVHDEIRLPRQHRTAISLGFSQVEEENYQRLFEQACREIEVNEDGSPIASDFNPESEQTRSIMRTWLGRLRQTCVHPQIGAFNRKTLGAREGGLRTVNEVLEAMMTQNTASVKQDQRMMFVLIASRAQVILESRREPQKAIDLLMEFLKDLEVAVADCRSDVEAEIEKRAAEKEARKLRKQTRSSEEPIDLPDTVCDETITLHYQREDWEESDEEDEEDFEDGSNVRDLNKLKNRLRDIVEVNHIFHFYLGGAYFNLKDEIPEDDEERKEERAHFEKLEDEHYEEAKKLRKVLMSDTEMDVNRRIASIQKRTDNQDFVEIPEIIIDEQKGGIESTSIMDDIQALAEKLNEQADILDEWREKLIQILQMPLIDQDDAEELEGDELQQSAEQQDEGFLYVALLRTVIADRAEALTGITSGLAAAEIKSAEKRLDEEDEKHRQLFQELKSKREEVKPLNIEDDIVAGVNAQPFSMRGLVHKLRRLANPFQDASKAATSRAKVEAGLVNLTLKALAPILAEQDKALKGLEKEISFLADVFNSRVDFYRQLQAVSDTVTQFDEEKALKAYHVRDVDALYEKLEALGRNYHERVAKAKSKGRFLQHLAETQGDSQRMCIICQDPVETGVLTICGHQFCRECMTAWYKNHPSCPVCKRALRKVDLHPVTYRTQEIRVEREKQKETAETLDDAEDAQGIEIYTGIEEDTFKQIKKISVAESFGSKIDMIVRHLIWIRRRNGGKSVLFSQWKEVLDVLGRALKENGIGYSSLEEKRGLNDFKTDDKTEVFLLHAKSQSAGLTLVTASNVFLVEPLVNTGLEVQAIARVHRIGQKRETNVFLYVIGNTVEEGVWRSATKRRIEMLEREEEEVPKKRRRVSEVDDKKGKKRARDFEEDEEQRYLEVQLELANSLELQARDVSKMVEKGQGGGEVVEAGQLWDCLFGVKRVDKRVEIEATRREQMIEGREQGRGNVVNDAEVGSSGGAVLSHGARPRAGGPSPINQSLPNGRPKKRLKTT